MSRKDAHKFYFLKTLITLLCIRISVEEHKDIVNHYWRILKELGEFLIFASESWVSQKSDESKHVQEKLSLAVGFIIYFLHREIRWKEEPVK